MCCCPLRGRWTGGEVDPRLRRSVHRRRRARAGRRRSKRAERSLKLAFGIDQEVRRGDDTLARLQPFQNNKLTAGLRPQRNIPRLQIPASMINKDDVSSPRLENS